jgi:hypothetical protein
MATTMKTGARIEGVRAMAFSVPTATEVQEGR